MIKKNWDLEDMQDQSGKTVLITGANDGLGYHLTRAFAQKNAHIIMACRNMAKAEAAKKEVSGLYPAVGIDIVPRR